MSPTLKWSSAIQLFKCDNVIEICNRIISIWDYHICSIIHAVLSYSTAKTENVVVTKSMLFIKLNIGHKDATVRQLKMFTITFKIYWSLGAI